MMKRKQFFEGVIRKEEKLLWPFRFSRYMTNRNIKIHHKECPKRFKFHIQLSNRNALFQKFRESYNVPFDVKKQAQICLQKFRTYDYQSFQYKSEWFQNCLSSVNVRRLYNWYCHRFCNLFGSISSILKTVCCH